MMNSRLSTFFIGFTVVSSILILMSLNDNFSLLPKEEVSEVIDNNAVKDGLVVTKGNNGKVKTEIMYNKGVKHGLAKSYYANGNIKNEINYVNGIKQGTASLYFQKGGLNRATEYKDGKRDGVMTKYYMNGQIASTVTYSENLMANDLKEYRKSGEERSSFPELKIYATDNIATTGEYIINVTFSRDAGRADYYLGELVNGKFFDKTQVLKLPDSKGVGSYVLTPPPGMFTMQKLKFIGKLKTAKGNWVIQTKVFNLAIEG